MWVFLLLILLSVHCHQAVLGRGLFVSVRRNALCVLPLSPPTFLFFRSTDAMARAHPTGAVFVHSDPDDEDEEDDDEDDKEDKKKKQQKQSTGSSSDSGSSSSSSSSSSSEGEEEEEEECEKEKEKEKEGEKKREEKLKLAAVAACSRKPSVPLPPGPNLRPELITWNETGMDVLLLYVCVCVCLEICALCLCVCVLLVQVCHHISMYAYTEDIRMLLYFSAESLDGYLLANHSLTTDCHANSTPSLWLSCLPYVCSIHSPPVFVSSISLFLQTASTRYVLSLWFISNICATANS